MRLHKQGLTHVEIARRVGCNDRTVWRTLKRMGAPSRFQDDELIITRDAYDRAIQDSWKEGYNAARNEIRRATIRAQQGSQWGVDLPEVRELLSRALRLVQMDSPLAAVVEDQEEAV